MFSEIGFLGSRAPLYIDVIAVIFLLLPLLFFFSIRFAIKKEIKKHMISQLFIFIVMLLSVIVFEVGMRLAGGFPSYLPQALNEAFFISFLVFHIITAIVVINTWSYQLITAVKAYRKGTLTGEVALSHRRIGKIVIAGIALTLLQASALYYMLFML